MTQKDRKSSSRINARQLFAVAVAFALISGASIGQAFAKDKKVKLTDEQININNKAVRLLAQEPPQTLQAIEIVQAALVLGEKGDLLYLTLGRAHQLAGQCEQAKVEFESATNAPGVEGVPDDFVSRQLVDYRDQMKMGCDGHVIVECVPDTLELAVGERALTCNERSPLAPGSHTVEVRNPKSGAKLSIQVQIIGAQDTRSRIELADPEPVDEPAPKDGREEPEPFEPVDPVAPVEPARRASWDLALRVPMGFCTTSLTRGENQATATDGSACFAAGLESTLTRPAGKFELGLHFSGQAIFGTGLGLVRADTKVSTIGADFELRGELWLTRVFALLGGFDWRPRGILFEEGGVSEPGLNSLNLLGGLGVGLELGHLMGLDHFGLTLRTIPAIGVGSDGRALDNLPLSIGWRMDISDLLIGANYNSWRGSLTGSNSEVRMRTEQYMFTLGYRFDGVFQASEPAPQGL